MTQFSTGWDVDKYKNSYESDEHWQLRRQFMVAHKDKFPEFRLVCLTQVFFNMEFLGCKYPEKTMELVNRLANEVAEEFRESRKGKLKRTFVGAQDAAGAKAKGIKPPPGATEGSQNKQDSDVVDQPPPMKKARLEQVVDEPAPGKKPCQDQVDDEPAPAKKLCQDQVDDPAPPVKKESKDSNLIEHEADLREIAKTFVLMTPPAANSTITVHPVKIIDYNFHSKNKIFKHEGNRVDGWTCELMVNPGPESTKKQRAKYTIASCFCPTQGEGKYLASSIAIGNLKKFCTYVEPNPEWFVSDRTPEFIQNRIPCSRSPPSYLIMSKSETGYITAKVADDLFKTFNESSNEEMFFLDTEYDETEKINLMNRSNAHRLRFRHFGPKKEMKDRHVCVYKSIPAEEIVEQARKLNWKHPKYIVTLKKH